HAAPDGHEADDYRYLVDGGSRELFATRSGYNRAEVRLGDGSATVLDFLIKGQRGDSPIVHAREGFSLMLKYSFNRAAERVIFGISQFDTEGVEIGACDRRVDAIILTVIGDRRHTNGLADMQMECSVNRVALAKAGDVVA